MARELERALMKQINFTLDYFSPVKDLLSSAEPTVKHTTNFILIWATKPYVLMFCWRVQLKLSYFLLSSNQLPRGIQETDNNLKLKSKFYV